MYQDWEYNYQETDEYDGQEIQPSQDMRIINPMTMAAVIPLIIVAGGFLVMRIVAVVAAKQKDIILAPQYEIAHAIKSLK